MIEPIWVSQEDIIWAHDQQIVRHGGKPGIRDLGLLESALGRPRHRYSYGAVANAELASAYAFGIAKNHPFFDGNKRTAWIAIRFFLSLNDYKVTYTTEEAVEVMLALASGNLSEEALTEWLASRISPT